MFPHWVPLLVLTQRRLWDTIRNFEEVKLIAQLTEEHYRQHGRPLRIAVDEADWRFNNLTSSQVYAIRDGTYMSLLVPADANMRSF